MMPARAHGHLPQFFTWGAEDQLGSVNLITAAKRKRWELMITINPMPITGGTGSPMNTIATF
jgi:hypothetical protein